MLGIFSKHKNKWFIHWDYDELENKPNSMQFKILARMVKLDGMKCIVTKRLIWIPAGNGTLTVSLLIV